MSDDLWLSLPRVAATPKKDKPEPRPQEPMRAQIKGPRRNPSTDQKKQRRQLKRRPTKTAAESDLIGYLLANYPLATGLPPVDGGYFLTPDGKLIDVQGAHEDAAAAAIDNADIRRMDYWNLWFLDKTGCARVRTYRDYGHGPAMVTVIAEHPLTSAQVEVLATPVDSGPRTYVFEVSGKQVREVVNDYDTARDMLRGRLFVTAAWGEVKDYWDMTGDIPVWTQPHDEVVRDALHSWKGDPISVRVHITHAINHDPQPDSGSGKVMRAWAEALLTEIRNAPHVPFKLYRGEIMRTAPYVGERIEWLLRGAAPKRSVAKRFAKEDPRAYDTEIGVLRIITDTTGLHIADYNIGSGMDQIEDEYLLAGTYEVTAVDDTKKPIEATMRQVSTTTSRWSRKAKLEVTWTEPGEVGNRTHITMEENGTVPLAVIAGLSGVMDEVPGEHRNKQGLAWEEFKADIARNGILNPIFVTIDYGQAPRISEGNHRRDAAVELGLTEVPVQIRYFGHAEQQGRLVERASKVAKTAGWVRCSDGQERWGPYGAAGVLFRNKQSDGYHYLLAKRGAGTDSGGTWAYPGGALDSPGEDPTTAALREAREELGSAVPKTFRVVEVIEDRPVPEWAYWTTIAEVDEKFEGGEYDWETDEEGWFSADEVEALNLHPAVRQIWPRLRSVAAKQEVVTDEDGREWTLIWTPTTLYHATGLTASEEILIAGFRIPKMPINGADYGPGIYFTPDRDWVESYGPRVIEAEIVPGAKILDITHLWPAGVIDHSYEQLSRARVRELADEYGCVGIFDGDMVCVFDPTKVRAIRIGRKMAVKEQFWHGTVADIEVGGFIEAASTIGGNRALARDSGVIYRHPDLDEDTHGDASDYAWFTRTRGSAEDWAWASAEANPDKPRMYLYRCELPNPDEVENMGDVLDGTTDDEYVAPYGLVVEKIDIGENVWYGQGTTRRGSRTIRLYHGTTSMALDKIRSSGQIITLDPAAVAAEIEHEYGLPAGSVLGETSFYFSRDRQTDPHIYFTSSTDTASSYAKGGSEIVFDALISAWFVMHPDPNNERETTDPVAMQREPWVREQMAKHHGEPTLLTLDIPVEFVWEHFDDHSRQHFGTIDKFIEVLDEYGLDSAQLKAPIPASYITQTQRVS